MNGDGHYGMEDVELRSVALKAPLNRSLSKDPDLIEHVVETSFGNVTVATRGDRSRPALLTYHDLGLNHVSNFQAFSNYPEVADILRQFCIYHVNAPGQEDGAAPWPESVPYPSMDQLAEEISEILNHFAIVKYVGIGVGLGGNVLLRHALKYPERVDSLMVINTTKEAAGWIEWGYQKRNIKHMRSSGITQAVLDYLIWHHFGSESASRAHDLVNVYTHYLSNELQAGNLAKLAEQYIWRTDVGICRENNLEAKGDAKTLKVPVLNIVGAMSPFVEETVTLNGCLNPANSNWIKVRDSAMVLEENPDQVAEAFRLFLQGQGYCLKLRRNHPASNGH